MLLFHIFHVVRLVQLVFSLSIPCDDKNIKQQYYMEYMEYVVKLSALHNGAGVLNDSFMRNEKTKQITLLCRKSYGGDNAQKPLSVAWGRAKTWPSCHISGMNF